MGDKSIQLFYSEEFGELTTFADSHGNPWFVARDVSDALGYRMPSDMTRRLDADEKDTQLMRTRGGMQRAAIINEPGLYSAVIGSKIPQARSFKRWITHDVLPAIRANGGYIAVNGTETNEELLSRALIVANDAIKRKDALIDKLAPKARFADAVSAADGTCLVGELAKMLRQNGIEVGQNRLFEWLRADGYLGRFGSNYNVPTQRAMELGLFRIKETAVHKADGSVTISRTPKVTGKGQTYFFARYAYGNEEPTL